MGLSARARSMNNVGIARISGSYDMWTLSMDKRDWIIIGLSLQLTLTGLMLTKVYYQLGYERGRVHELTNWNEDGDGYCLADLPPHKGQCHDSVLSTQKEHKDYENKTSKRARERN